MKVLKRLLELLSLIRKEFNPLRRADHCSGNTTISVKVATTLPENRHKQDTQHALKYKPKGDET
jgi:hypothetical protein